MNTPIQKEVRNLMSGSITLSSIREDTEREFGSFKVVLDENNTVELLNPVRLSATQRKALSAAAQDEESESDEDLEGRFVAILRAVADSETGADKVLAALSPRGYVDLAELSKVIGAYMEDQKVGEASASQD